MSTVSSGLKHVDEKILDVFWYHNYETQEWDEQFDIHLFLMNEKSNGMAYGLLMKIAHAILTFTVYQNHVRIVICMRLHCHE